MLKPRIIPCLLLSQGGLVKTQNFKSPKYVGDPLNAVKIFNEKEVDELMLLDINASIDGVAPDFNLIHKIAMECRMPLAYGGGIANIDCAERLIGLGVEKVVIGTAAIQNQELISSVAKRLGSQSVAVVLNVKKNLFNKHQAYIASGKIKISLDLVEFASNLESMGAGELVINSIANDGVMGGYDYELLEQLRESTRLPITILGGAGTLSDIEELISKFGIIGAGAGSLFVFKGKYRAVLINYPDRNEKDALIKRGMVRYEANTTKS